MSTTKRPARSSTRPRPVGEPARRGPARERERDPQRHRGQSVGEVVHRVGEQGDGPGDHDHRTLQHCGEAQHEQADLHRPGALGARLERGVGRLRGVVAVRSDDVEQPPLEAVVVIVTMPVVIVTVVVVIVTAVTAVTSLVVIVIVVVVRARLRTGVVVVRAWLRTGVGVAGGGRAGWAVGQRVHADMVTARRVTVEATRPRTGAAISRQSARTGGVRWTHAAVPASSPAALTGPARATRADHGAATPPVRGVFCCPRAVPPAVAQRSPRRPPASP